MTEPDQRQFKLLDPEGSVIMSGPLNIILERLPGTKARNAALDEMLQTAVQAVEAEERQEQARLSTVKMLSDVTAHLSARMDAYIARREAQRKADEEEAEREEQLQIEAMLDGLPDFDNPGKFPDPLLMADPQMPSPTEQDESLSYPGVPMSNVTEPPVLGHDPEELANPPARNAMQTPQPIAISLNAQEE
jgi:hypothetical protein